MLEERHLYCRLTVLCGSEIFVAVVSASPFNNSKTFNSIFFFSIFNTWHSPVRYMKKFLSPPQKVWKKVAFFALLSFPPFPFFFRRYLCKMILDSFEHFISFRLCDQTERVTDYFSVPKDRERWRGCVRGNINKNDDEEKDKKKVKRGKRNINARGRWWWW